MAATTERELLDRLAAPTFVPEGTSLSRDILLRREIETLHQAFECLQLPERMQATIHATTLWRSLPAELKGRYVGLLSGLWTYRIHSRQPERILEVSDLLARLGEKYDSVALRAEAKHALGMWHLSNGHFKPAIQALELSRALFATTGENRLDDVRATVLLSSAHRLGGDHRSAFALLQRARAQCLQEECASLLASVSLNLGLLFIESADLAAAKKAFEFAVEASRILGSRKRFLRGTLGLAIANIRAGYWVTAKKECLKALDLASDLKLFREVALAHEFLGEIATLQSDWLTAISHYSRASKFVTRSKAAPDVRVELHRQLAQMWLSYGDDHYALIHIKKGLALSATGAIAEDLLALQRASLEIDWLNGEESALQRLTMHFKSAQRNGFGFEALTTAYRISSLADSVRLPDLASAWWVKTAVLCETMGAKELLSVWRSRRKSDSSAASSQENIPVALPSSRPDGSIESAPLFNLPTVNLQGHGIVTKCEILTEQSSWIAKIAPTALPVLIRGDSGTGKELFANLVHDLSYRKEGGFYAINCAAMPTELLESELFGHRRGSFTGAISDKTGLFRAAHGGTLFLDEIGEMSLMAQAKLLRVIETGEIRRVGDTESEIVDVRIVAATNVDLEMAVERSTFRRDLYYRLKGLEIHLPPLRERLEDVPHLAKHFVSKACTEMGKTLELTFESTQWLLGQSWPGNVRELRLTMERAVALAPETGVLHPYHFHSGPGTRKHLSLASEIEGVERARLLNALEIAGWNKTRAAELLGMRRTTLTGKVKRLGIERPKKD